MSGLFGPVTEGAVLLSESESLELKMMVLRYAKSPDFKKKLKSLRSETQQAFWNLLNVTEFVGSSAGGAAGYLKLANLPRGKENPLKLRYALQMTEGPGNLWGFIPLKVAMRHELLHFLREAESITNRGVSLFEAEVNASILGRVCLMLREETFVWFRTLIR